MISQADLEKTIRLAHLSVPDDKKEVLLQQLQDVLAQMTQLDTYDLETVLPYQQTGDYDQYLRDDCVETYSDLSLKKNAAEWEQGAFHVPPILKR